jgi:gluconokinase
MNYPCSPHETTGGIVYFRRMIEKIRLMAAGTLHPDLQANLGIGFDERCVDFLGVSYADLAEAVRGGLSDEAALEWCFAHGRKPSEEEIEVWNGFMSKRGWRDAITPTLVRRKAESGFTDRADIQTMFDYIDADEGRALRTPAE